MKFQGTFDKEAHLKYQIPNFSNGFVSVSSDIRLRLAEFISINDRRCTNSTVRPGIVTC